MSALKALIERSATIDAVSGVMADAGFDSVPSISEPMRGSADKARNGSTKRAQSAGAGSESERRDEEADLYQVKE